MDIEGSEIEWLDSLNQEQTINLTKSSWNFIDHLEKEEIPLIN